MTNVDRSSNTGRLEFLRDGKGIYGLIGEVPAARSHAAQTVTFVLRPDIIREGGIDDGLACAALQTLPRRMSWDNGISLKARWDGMSQGGPPGFRTN